MTMSPRVQKFRSIEDMNAATAGDREGADFERFLRHCARYWALAPRIYPRGVFKFRSVDEAQRARERHKPAPQPQTPPDSLTALLEDRRRR